MSVTWTIASMDRDITQDGKANVVTSIHWRASETDTDGNSGSSYGSVSVTLGSQSFIAFKDITQEIGIQWAKDALGADEVKNIEDSIASQIDALANPTTASGVPF